MGVKIVVQQDESIELALLRLKERLRQTLRCKGPCRWMRIANRVRQTKEYYQQPSLIKRLKRAKKKLLSRR